MLSTLALDCQPRKRKEELPQVGFCQKWACLKSPQEKYWKEYFQSLSGCTSLLFRAQSEGDCHGPDAGWASADSCPSLASSPSGAEVIFPDPLIVSKSSSVTAVNSGPRGQCVNWVYEIDTDSSKPSRGGGDGKKTANIFPRFSLIIFLEVSKQSIQLLNNVEALPDTKEKISVPLLSSFSGAQNTCSLFTERCQSYSHPGIMKTIHIVMVSLCSDIVNHYI